MFEKFYPHKLSILTLDKTYGWIELDKLKNPKKRASGMQLEMKKAACKCSSTENYPYLIKI